MSKEALHIASVLVHAKPEHRSEVAAWLAALPDTEVRAEDPAGKIVAVVESTDEKRILNVIDKAQENPAVLSAALIYHEMLDPETANELQEEATS